MNIADYRSSFTVFVLDGDLNRGGAIAEDLGNSGYNAQHILGEKSLQEELAQNPPHVAVVMFGDASFAPDRAKLNEKIQWLLLKLPELHVILLAEDEDLEEATQLYEEGVYDVVSYPIYPSAQLLRAVDRAATTDYYVYLNEQLKEDLGRPNQKNPAANFEMQSLYFGQLRAATDEKEALRLCMAELHRHLNQCDLVFLRFVRGRATLVAESSLGIKMSALENVGVELRQTEPRYKEILLLRPEKLVGLRELVRSGMQRRQFAAFPVMAGKKVDGLIVALPKDPVADRIQEDSYIRVCVEALGFRLSEIEARAKLEKMSVYDEDSESLNRAFFMKKLREEVSRARRILRPVALLILQVDHFGDVSLSYDSVDVEKFLKNMNSLFLKNSRLTDLVGRLADDQFGLILPHTERKGAAIKAERLRRIIESADFSKLLGQHPKMTVSIGVSEYPSTCHDATDLLKKADEALCEVIKVSHNKVCVASAPPNFTPDFRSGETP